MKCRVCGKTAVIKLKSHNTAFCVEHFVEFFERRVERAIRRFKMFGKGSNILVGVSGGKDSLSAWLALKRLGYDVTGVFINLGIVPNSDLAQRLVERFASENKLKLAVLDVKDYLGATIPEARNFTRKPTCSVCGMVRRYILNKFALENGFDVLVTGHNLDDEAATLFGNIMDWNPQYLARQYPVLPEQDGFVRKVKPLVLCSEYETLAYAVVMRIGFDRSRCPFSKGASSQFYKHILNLIEHDMPGTKQRFVTGFYEKISPIISGQAKKLELKRCKICGYPTTAGDVCAFCRLKELIRKG